MSTVNGIGTMFYGWRHQKGGPSTATKWLTLLYLPVAPLARVRLTPLTDFEGERFNPSAGQIAAALVGYGSRSDAYRISGGTPLNLAECLTTYAKAYLLLPLLMLWPIVLLVIARQAIGPHPEWEGQPWFTPVVVVTAAMILLNAVAVPMWALQVARGRKSPVLGRAR